MVIVGCCGGGRGLVVGGEEGTNGGSLLGVGGGGWVAGMVLSHWPEKATAAAVAMGGVFGEGWHCEGGREEGGVRLSWPV